MIKDKYFIVDAETDGLYGDFISVAVIVTDIDFNELERAYFGIYEKNLKITDEWVRKNVLPKMGEYTECCDEAELLERVWTLWMKYRETADVIGDVIHPVESRLFTKCVQRDEATRKMLGPYPFLDLASVFYAITGDPMIDRKNFYEIDENCQHNALDDVVGIKNALQKLMRGKKKIATGSPDEGCNRPYSYHTFMFPFIWETDTEIEREKVIEAINGSNNWDRVYSFNSSEDESGLIEGYKNGKYSKDEFSENIRELYQAKQYFTEPARQLLYDENYKDKDERKDTESVAINYRFNKIKESKTNVEVDKQAGTESDEDEGLDYWYVIKKTEGKITYTYKLLIKEVFLSIYNSGVGILRLQMEYYGDKTTNEPCESEFISDFNRINECGRRIRLPFISENNYLTADSIEISIEQKLAEFLILVAEDGQEDDRKEVFTNTNRLFMGENISSNDVEEMEKALSPWKVMNPITYFLDVFYFDEKTKNEEDKWENRNKIFIKPTIDDRMYTYALIDDLNVMTKHASDLSQEELYEIGFIDGKGCSCPDDIMRKEIMDRCCYRRWLAYGTLDIITHHSFVRITGATDYNDIKDAVIRPFRIQYNQMAQIALTQRATLLAMTDMAAKISTEKGKAKRLHKLHTKWVKALSQIMLTEVTVQEQGIEEFNMMRNEFYIPESMKHFEKQQEALYQNEENKQGHFLDRILTVLAIAQVAGVLVPYLIDRLECHLGLYKDKLKLIDYQARPIATWVVLGIYVVPVGILIFRYILKRKK